GEDLRKTLHSPFGRRIRAATDRTDAPAYGRELQDPARLLTSHYGDGSLRKVYHAKKIGLDLGAKVLNGCVLDRGKVPVTSVVDQHVEATECVNRQLDSGDR